MRGKEIEGLNLLKELEGEEVDINKGHLQKFSDELVVKETDRELILDNLYILNEDEDVILEKAIHIKRENIIDINTTLSDDISILLIDCSEIRVCRI